MKNVLFVFIFFYAHLLFPAMPKGCRYIFPTPGATRVSPHSTIIVRFEKIAPDNIHNLSTCIRVRDENGDISGTIRAADEKTLIFQPHIPFALGALVHVALEPDVHSNFTLEKTVTFTFQITQYELTLKGLFSEIENNRGTPLQKISSKTGPRIMPNGVAVPGDFPHIKVTVHKETADGYIFLNHWREQAPYNIIFDNDGAPVWYARQENGDRRWNFKVQKNGLITMFTRSGALSFLSYDKNFNPIDEYRAAGGYATDEHELVILENGHYVLIGLRLVYMDMSHIGGYKNAVVYETTVQEFTPDHQLVFNWPGLEHLRDGLPYMRESDPTDKTFSFPHINAVDVDEDGHILVSSRNLSEVTKINRQTGEIIWRLGGAHNQFTFVNDSLHGFNSQHDIRALGNGLYSVFDNGHYHDPPRSRGVIYKVDTDAMTATLVWEYKNPPGSRYTKYMGNFQKLPNGNSFINWADAERPKATEVTPDGEVVYEMNFVDRYACYRSFRFPWDGVVAAPNLIVQSDYNRVVLIFNKFGDEDVAYYNIYGGKNPNPTALLDTSKATLKSLSNLENRVNYYFRVTAVSSGGIESPCSEEKTGFAILKMPGDNLVDNGDFSEKRKKWHLTLDSTATATWNTITEDAHIFIEHGGADMSSIALGQGKIGLTRGLEYRLEFDAWADEPRVIEVMVSGDRQNVNYSKIGVTALGARKRRYSYIFTMSHNTDFEAELRFLFGGSKEDVYVDNIELRQNIVAKAGDVDSTPVEFDLAQNYPNPFNASTTIAWSLEKSEHVTLKVYTLTGQHVMTLVNEKQNRGQHGIALNAADLSSGVYLYQIQTGSHVFTRKMTLLR